MKIKPCLFDMDGTIADHTGALMRDLAKIQSPNEPPVTRHDDDEPEWARERKRLIRSQRDWWLNLPEIQLGMDVYDAARRIGFQINILTKGPWTCAHAWTEKVQWVRKHLHDDVKITISEDKSIVYGRVLVDDYIPYVMGWLYHRPRGQVIMVANEENEDIVGEATKYTKKIGLEKSHEFFLSFWRAVEEKRVLRYNGDNFTEVVKKLQWAYDRE